MRAAEFEIFRQRRINEHAAAQVDAGSWEPGDALQLAAQGIERWLPDGLNTNAARLFVGERPGGTVVGFVWVALEQEADGVAWLNSIEVLPEHRGRGYGQALLSAVEQELQTCGIDQLELSVFESNEFGCRLFETSGFETVSVRMRKRLGPAR